jgi:hypothetical protein
MVACQTSPFSTETIEANSGPTQVAETAVPTLVITIPEATRIPASQYADYEIVTLLPRDAIPAIFNPSFLTTAEANNFYEPTELVIGVVFNNEARAYSVPYLSNHEIVNDSISGVKIAVTW